MKEIKILTMKELSLLGEEELNSHLDDMAESMEAIGVDCDLIEQFFCTALALSVLTMKGLEKNKT